MKKMLSIVLVIALLLTVMPLSIAAEDIGESEGTYVNVYDAQSLGTALATEGANIVLWSNITYLLDDLEDQQNLIYIEYV